MSESSTKETAKEIAAAPAATTAPTAANGWVTADKATADWWHALDQRVHACIRMWLEGEWGKGQCDMLNDALGEVLATERQKAQAAIARFEERLIRIEAASNFEQRFNNLAGEIKRGSEIPQSELLARIDALQRQLDELKKVAGQPGPPGPPGKLPLAREYVPECVHYQNDVVTHNGALWQAACDTARAPPHDDWTLLARAGRDAVTPNVCGTFSACGKKLDIVVSDGAAFIAKRDNPGFCPGDGWQLMSRQGRQGRRGEDGTRGLRGEKGEKGEPGATLHSWQPDPERYRVSPLFSDGTVGPMLELRDLFQRFLYDYGEAER